MSAEYFVLHKKEHVESHFCPSNVKAFRFSWKISGEPSEFSDELDIDVNRKSSTIQASKDIFSLQMETPAMTAAFERALVGEGFPFPPERIPVLDYRALIL